MVRLVEYRYALIPAAVKLIQAPIGLLAVRVSPALRLMATDMKSPHPSPIPPASYTVKQLEFAGPPVRRLETPWVYSWMITLASKLQSRLGTFEFQMYMDILPG